MTSLEVIYDAFLAKILEDEWESWDEDDVAADWRALLDGAIPWFKFPRVDLTIQDDCFVGDLTNEEIQILAGRMKCEWLNRNILTWENIKAEYEERDFSQANLIDKLVALLNREEEKVADLERIYYRSIKGSPFKYRRLAGDQYV